MEHLTVFPDFFQCCHSPSLPSDRMLKTFPKKISLKSPSKLTKNQPSSKISLRDRSVQKRHKHNQTQQLKPNPSNYAPSSGMTLHPPKIIKKIPNKLNQLHHFKIKNPRSIIPTSKFVHRAPTLLQTAKLNPPKVNELIVKERITKSERASQLKKSLKNQQESKDDRDSWDKRLGESKNTVVSGECENEESVKVQQSVIVINYFHPREGQLEQWLQDE